MALAAAMLFGKPEQKKVVGDQLNKLATADAKVSGEAAADLAAGLATKLASTARKEVKGATMKPKSRSKAPYTRRRQFS